MSWRSRSYDEVPALAVRGPELRRNLRIVTVAWMYGVVWMVFCLSGSHVTDFNRTIGFDDLAFGLLAAIPFVATLSQLFAALLIDRTGLRKYQFLQFATIHRAMWIPMALAPLILPVPSWWVVATILAFYGVSYFSESLSRPAWMNWMGDLIPRRIRGRFFAVRSRYTNAVMIVTVIGVAVLMDHDLAIWRFIDQTFHLGLLKDETPQTLSRLRMYSVCILFAIGAVFGMIDPLLFMRVRELMPPQRTAMPPRPQVSLGSQLGSLLVEPMKDRVFRRYVLYGSTITLSITIGGNFFVLFCLENLQLNFLATNVLFLVIGPLADMASSMGWGRLIDRWGRRPVLILACLLTVLSPVPWFFATRTTPHPMFLDGALNWVASGVGGLIGHADWRLVQPGMPVGAYLLGMLACIMGGVAWSGINLAQTGVILGFSDGAGRSRYIAAATVLTSMGGAVGGVIGGVVAQSLKGAGAIGPFLWGNYHAVFLLTMLVRGAAIAWLVGMPDPGSVPFRTLLQHLRLTFQGAVQTTRSYPLRLLGWGQAAPPGGDAVRPVRKSPKRGQPSSKR